MVLFCSLQFAGSCEVCFKQDVHLSGFHADVRAYEEERRLSMHAALALAVLGSKRCFGFFMRPSADGRVPANREEANSDPLH